MEDSEESDAADTGRLGELHSSVLVSVVTECENPVIDEL